MQCLSTSMIPGPPLDPNMASFLMHQGNAILPFKASNDSTYTARSNILVPRKRQGVWQGNLHNQEEIKAIWGPFCVLPALLSDMLVQFGWHEKCLILKRVFHAVLRKKNLMMKQSADMPAEMSSNIMTLGDFRKVLQMYPCIEMARVQGLYSFINCQGAPGIGETEFISGMLVSSPEASHLCCRQKDDSTFITTTEISTGILPVTLTRLQMIFLEADRDKDGVLAVIETSQLLNRVMTLLAHEKCTGRETSHETHFGPIFWETIQNRLTPLNDRDRTGRFSGNSDGIRDLISHFIWNNLKKLTVYPERPKSQNTLSKRQQAMTQTFDSAGVKTQQEVLSTDIAKTRSSRTKQLPISKNDQNIQQKTAWQCSNVNQRIKTAKQLTPSQENRRVPKEQSPAVLSTSSLSVIPSVVLRKSAHTECSSQVDFFSEIDKKELAICVDSSTINGQLTRSISSSTCLTQRIRELIPTLPSIFSHTCSIQTERLAKSSSEFLCETDFTTDLNEFSVDKGALISQSSEEVKKPKKYTNVIEESHCTSDNHFHSVTSDIGHESSNIMSVLTSVQATKTELDPSNVYSILPPECKRRMCDEQQWSAMNNQFFHETVYNASPATSIVYRNADCLESYEHQSGGSRISCRLKTTSRGGRSADHRSSSFQSNVFSRRPLGSSLLDRQCKSSHYWDAIEIPQSQTVGSSWKPLTPNPQQGSNTLTGLTEHRDANRANTHFKPHISAGSKFTSQNVICPAERQLSDVDAETINYWRKTYCEDIARQLIERYRIPHLIGIEGLCFSAFVKAAQSGEFPGLSLLFRTRDDFCLIVKRTSPQVTAETCVPSTVSEFSPVTSVDRIRNNLTSRQRESSGANSPQNLCSGKENKVLKDSKYENSKMPTATTNSQKPLQVRALKILSSSVTDSLTPKVKGDCNVDESVQNFEKPEAARKKTDIPKPHLNASHHNDMLQKKSRDELRGRQRQKDIKTCKIYTKEAIDLVTSASTLVNQSTLCNLPMPAERSQIATIETDNIFPCFTVAADLDIISQPDGENTGKKVFQRKAETRIKPGFHDVTARDVSPRTKRNRCASLSIDDRYQYRALDVMRQPIDTSLRNLQLARNTLAVIDVLKIDGWRGESNYPAPTDAGRARLEASRQHLSYDLLISLCDAVADVLRMQPLITSVTGPVSIILQPLRKSEMMRYPYDHSAEYELHSALQPFCQGSENEVAMRIAKNSSRISQPKLILLGGLSSCLSIEESIELIALSFAIKLCYPSSFIPLRGNIWTHQASFAGPTEDYVVGVLNGVEAECCARFGNTKGQELCRRLYDVMEYLPICAVVTCSRQEIVTEAKCISKISFGTKHQGGVPSCPQATRFGNAMEESLVRRSLRYPLPSLLIGLSNLEREFKPSADTYIYSMPCLGSRISSLSDEDDESGAKLSLTSITPKPQHNYRTRASALLRSASRDTIEEIGDKYFSSTGGHSYPVIKRQHTGEVSSQDFIDWCREFVWAKDKIIEFNKKTLNNASENRPQTHLGITEENNRLMFSRIASDKCVFPQYLLKKSRFTATGRLSFLKEIGFDCLIRPLTFMSTPDAICVETKQDFDLSGKLDESLYSSVECAKDDCVGAICSAVEIRCPLDLEKSCLLMTMALNHRESEFQHDRLRSLSP